MTFGPQCYVPVLKIKRGEKSALAKLAAPIRSRTVPVLEVVERKQDKSPSLSKHLDTAFAGLGESVSAYSRILLDTRELAPDGPAAAEAVFDRAAATGMTFTPVTGVTRTHDIGAALQHTTNGLAIRLTRHEFEAGSLVLLQGFLGQHGLDPHAIDLIVDLGAADDMIAEGIANLAAAFLSAVPDVVSWRTLSVVGCAFPLSLKNVSKHSHDLVERAEWKAWRDYLYAQRATLKRLPTFGDCAIQHVKGVEGFDPKLMPVSAAVRYALPADWLLIKGQSTRVVPPSEQFPVLARRLVEGDLQAYFRGADHCGGCLGIVSAAQGAPGFGSAEAWRRLGTIHHLTVAAEEVAALTWP